MKLGRFYEVSVSACSGGRGAAWRRSPRGWKSDRGVDTVPAVIGLGRAKMMRRVDVFFYGLFMDADALREKGLDPINVRLANVQGMTLRLGDRATLVPDPAGCVHGMLMALAHPELDRLYAEPGVSAYRPEALVAELADGSLVPALCFNIPTPAQTHRANPEYAARLQAVARRLGLPDDYVNSIR